MGRAMGGGRPGLAAAPTRRRRLPGSPALCLLVVAALFAVIQCEEHAHWKGPYQWGSLRANDGCSGPPEHATWHACRLLQITMWGTAACGKDEAIYNHDPRGSIHQ